MPMDKHFPTGSKELRVDSPGEGTSTRLAPGLRLPPGAEAASPIGTRHPAEITAPATATQETAQPSRSSDRWALIGCNAIVFCASVCIMVVELTASRLIASYVGNSLYTWTSVIGVVLAGISLGNYVGGRLADRFPPQKLLAWLFLAAGVTTFSVLLLNNLAAATERPEWINWQMWVMLVVAWVFFLPALSLGTISPVTASMALARSARTGITVGNIYAFGAVGSIFGTFLTGFWLIGEFGCRQVIWMNAAVLVVMAALVAKGQRVFRAVAVVGVLQLIVQYGIFSSATKEQMSNLSRTLAGIRSGWQTTEAEFDADEKALAAAAKKNDDAALLAARERTRWRKDRKQAEDEWAAWGERLGSQMHGFGVTLALRRDDPRQYNDESDYFTINIAELQSGNDVVKVLTQDHLVHSYYDRRNPTKLHYEYEQIYAAVTERAAARWNRRTAVELGPLPDDAFLAELPPPVMYDAQKGRLVTQGTMDFRQLRQLLSIGPYAAYWHALFSAWEQSNGDWNLAPQRFGNIIAIPLPRLPKGVAIPPDLSARVAYDRTLKSIVCTAPFNFKELLRLLAQGEMQDYVDAVWELYNQSRHTSTLFVGGGGFIFPRWIEANFPNEPLIDVAEIDPAVKLAAEKQLGLATEYGAPADGKTYVRTHIGDARKFVDDQVRANKKRAAAGQRPITYDFVYGDAFNDLSVPWHLTTLEYNTQISRLLTPKEGVYLVNMMDVYPRVLYPPDSEKVGTGETAFTGTFPQSLLSKKRLGAEFAPCLGEHKTLEAARQGPGFRLRYKAVMTKEVRDALKKLDVDAEGEPNTSDSGFAAAVAELYRQTNAPKVLDVTIPKKLTPANPLDDTWQSAPAPFANLQLFRQGDEGYRLGYRGVMSDETRKKLLEQAGKDEKLKTAVAALYRASQNEKFGQFLGRYVNTVKQVFPYVYLFTSNKDEPGDSRDTFVIVCALKELDFRNLDASGGYWKNGPFAWSKTDRTGKQHPFGEMPAILELARGHTLTDDFAPVDNLLAPVPLSRMKGDQ